MRTGVQNEEFSKSGERLSQLFDFLVGAVRFELTTTGTPFRVVDLNRLFNQSITFVRSLPICLTMLNGA